MSKKDLIKEFEEYSKDNVRVLLDIENNILDIQKIVDDLLGGK